MNNVPYQAHRNVDVAFCTSSKSVNIHVLLATLLRISVDISAHCYFATFNFHFNWPSFLELLGVTGARSPLEVTSESLEKVISLA